MKLLGAILFLVGVGMLVALVLVATEDYRTGRRRPPVQRANAASSPAMSPSQSADNSVAAIWNPQIGDIGRFGNASDQDGAVWVALDGSAFNEMLAAQDAQSLDTLARLAQTGKAKAYPTGTKVRIINASVFSRRVVVVDGEDAGKTGWVKAEFVVPPEPATSNEVSQTVRTTLPRR
jgi:hypothetical protein